MIDYIYKFDFAVLDAFSALRSPVMDKLQTVITYCGSGGIIWILTAFFFILFTKRKKTGVTLLVGLLLGLILGNLIMKHAVMRERPFTINPIELIIPPPSDRYSFPSGHTLSSFISAIIIFRSDKIFGAAAVAAAALIAISRMYLYVHFPTDIFAAVAMSFPIAFLADKITDKIMK